MLILTGTIFQVLNNSFNDVKMYNIFCIGRQKNMSTCSVNPDWVAKVLVFAFSGHDQVCRNWCNEQQCRDSVLFLGSV